MACALKLMLRAEGIAWVLLEATPHVAHRNRKTPMRFGATGCFALGDLYVNHAKEYVGSGFIGIVCRKR